MRLCAIGIKLIVEFIEIFFRFVFVREDFDYLLPFTVLGLAGIFTSKSKFGAYVGMAAVTAARFICHFVSGVAIWRQWAPEGMNKFVYSILYNGSFLSIDFAICIAVAIPLLQVRQMRKLLGLSEK